MSSLVQKYHQFQACACHYLKHLDGIPPLLFRLILFFPLYEAGARKFANFSSTSEWFASMGFPLPDVMTFLAASAEMVGGIFILIGFATRWAAIPLIVTMLVAALAVHWDNGWYAIAQSSDPEVASRLEMGRSILQEYGNYSWLTAKGNFAILQNGIEFAAIYFAMLASLFYTGGGRYFSVDYWLGKILAKPQ